MDLGIYTPEHKLELEKLLNSSAWQKVIRVGLVEKVKAERIEPNPTRDFIGTVLDQLLEFNEKRVKQLIAEGNKDEDYLLSELGKWPDGLGDKDPVISFLGLNVTADCNFKPKCIYCNQPWVEPSAGIEGWKRIIAEATQGPKEAGPYIYITGGEPLLLKEQIWGDDGLVRFATERGAGVNVNTNATMITPEVALYFIKSGLARLHISLDTPDRETQNFLLGGERFDKVMEGIYNVQLARDIVGVPYPIIHTNCVLTNRNLNHFPQLFEFVLAKHKQTADRNDPFNNDLFMHVIPVGGAGNWWLRPSEAEFRKFYEVIWPQVCDMWDAYQDGMGISKEQRGALFGYFSNPF
ncbi:TPA: radical SAM protein, partial [Candidatus Poribacteria bacterium]|nr:radical SAM protein [Candidatus Poribacteria bacterium]